MVKIDKEFKNLIPPLSAEELKQLEENILQDGCRDPLVTWNGILLDGHNRFEICERNNIAFKTVEKEFDDRDAAIEWIILNQFGRRNLPAYERAKLALRLKAVFADKAKANQKLSDGKGKQKSANLKAEPVETRKELAKIAGVSHDTIAKVEKIEAQASDEVKAKLSVGLISINQAHQQISRSEKESKRESRRQANRDKVESAQQPETLVSYLDICTGWKTAKELAKVTGHGDRKLRALANASEGRIVTGQRGYMAASNATGEEISHAANWLEHQAREMIRRATAIRNMAHRRIAA